MLYIASTWVLPVVLAITLHEAAHGWMAERFGDATARNMGRVTFNPIPHIDPLGTVILPGMLLLTGAPVLFGYAKPVPVDFRNLKPLYPGMLAVAAAGPGINVLMALAAALMLPLAAPESWAALNLFHAVLINCVLAVFNMLPILPLDGGRVLRALLPGALGERYARTERYGMLIVLALILSPLLGITFVLDAILGAAEWLVGLLLAVAT